MAQAKTMMRKVRKTEGAERFREDILARVDRTEAKLDRVCGTVESMMKPCTWVIENSDQLEVLYQKYFEYGDEDMPTETGYPPLIREMPEALAMDVAIHIGVPWPLPGVAALPEMTPEAATKVRALMEFHEGMRTGTLDQILAHRPAGLRKPGHFTLKWHLCLGALMGHRSVVTVLERAMTHASGRPFRGEPAPTTASQERRFREGRSPGVGRTYC